MLMPENLDLLKCLQPKIKEAMGKWQVGDNVFNTKLGVGVISEISESDTYGNVYIYIIWEAGRSADLLPATEKYLRIPKPIDPWNEKRGLWGMIDWSKWRAKNIGNQMHIEQVSSGGCAFRCNPFTALLKALAEQEKV